MGSNIWMVTCTNVGCLDRVQASGEIEICVRVHGGGRKDMARVMGNHLMCKLDNDL